MDWIGTLVAFIVGAGVGHLVARLGTRRRDARTPQEATELPRSPEIAATGRTAALKRDSVCLDHGSVLIKRLTYTVGAFERSEVHLGCAWMGCGRMVPDPQCAMTGHDLCRDLKRENQP